MALPVKYTGKPALPCLCADCYVSDRIVLHHQLLYCKTIERGQEKTSGTSVRNLICNKNRSTETKIVWKIQNKFSEVALNERYWVVGFFGSLRGNREIKFTLRTQRCLWKMERISETFFGISCTGNKVSSLDMLSLLPRTTGSSAVFALVVCGNQQCFHHQHLAAIYPLFSGLHQECWGAAISVLKFCTFSYFNLQPHILGMTSLTEDKSR